MKKIISLLLSYIMIFALSACGNNQMSGQASMNGEGANDKTEMVWTVKSCTLTYPSGFESVCYTAEISDSVFAMNFLNERKKGEVDRNSTIFDLKSNLITKMKQESQDYGKEVEDEGEITLTYDEATSTLTRLTVENGKETRKEVYVITWDEEERISKYDLTTTYAYYEDGSLEEEGKYEYTYTYQYGTENFTITCDEIQNEYVNDDYKDIIVRTVSTIPYDEKGNIETVESYVELDGKTSVNIGSDEPKRVSEKVISNWWGYITSHTINYSDGSSKETKGDRYTFDSEGRITKVAEESYNGMVSPDEEPETVMDIVDFTYDANGNLTNIKREVDGMVTNYAFEWMEIPAKLDGQIAMLSGSPHWSVAEYIDNFVDFNWEGRLTLRTYKKADFLSYIK